LAALRRAGLCGAFGRMAVLFSLAHDRETP
jgi:hypothetical protein